MINFDSARGGISLVTEKGMKSTSRLLVQRARGSDAGLYTCGPNNAPSAATRVHVLSGKKTDKKRFYEEKQLPALHFTRAYTFDSLTFLNLVTASLYTHTTRDRSFKRETVLIKSNSNNL